jgi:diguanylate cyclase (GGDEF)-like protein
MMSLGFFLIKEELIMSAEEKNSVPSLHLLVQSEKLQLLYHQSYPAIFISIINAVLLTAVLWSAQDHMVLLSWFVLLVVTALGRLYVFIRYHREKPEGKEILAWEKSYFITLILSSLIWGIGCVLIMPVDSELHQVVIFYFLIGMSGGAISVYSAHRLMTLATIAAVLLPSTVWFLFSGNFILVVMAVTAIIFFLSAIRATNVLSLALHQNFMMRHELRCSKEDAEKLARIDELTGLYNRRAFYENGKILTNENKRKKEELAMIIMDLDNFKKINDTLGHAAGDEALKQIGEILHQRLRESDISARIGGEEFGMILPATTRDKAVLLAEELRRVISETPLIFNGKSLTFTASFGVTSGTLDIDTLVRQADIAMYKSKESGRNVVSCDSSEVCKVRGRGD